MVQLSLIIAGPNLGKPPAGRKRQLNVMLKVFEFDNRILANLYAEPSFHPDIKGRGWQD